MSQIKQNLRKSERLQKLEINHVNKKNLNRNQTFLSSERKVCLKQENKKMNRSSELKAKIQLKQKAIKQTVVEKTNKIQRMLLDNIITKEDFYDDKISLGQMNTQNCQRKKIQQSLEEFQYGDQNELKSKQEETQWFQNSEQQNFVFNLIALQARSEFRFQFDWKNHEYWKDNMEQDQIKFKIQQDESFDLDSAYCCSFYSNNNDNLHVMQITNRIDNNQKSNQTSEKLEQQHQQTFNWNNQKVEENNQYQQDLQSLSFIKKQQQKKENQKDISDLINGTRVRKIEDEQSSVRQEDEQEETNNFHEVLHQAMLENTSSKDSIKEIHKLMRQRVEKTCVDFFLIELLWSELQQTTDFKILSFLQFLKCLIDMHQQDLLWLDEQSKKVYLI